MSVIDFPSVQAVHFFNRCLCDKSGALCDHYIRVSHPLSISWFKTQRPAKHQKQKKSRQCFFFPWPGLELKTRGGCKRGVEGDDIGPSGGR